MRTKLFLLLAMPLLVACAKGESEKPENDSQESAGRTTSYKEYNSLEIEGLKGKVKSVKSISYQAIERFGEVSKSDEIYGGGGAIPVYAAYIDPCFFAEYNEDGNLIKQIYYNDEGSTSSVQTNTWIGNSRVERYWYESEEELYESTKIVMKDGKPIDFEHFDKYFPFSVDYRDVVFDGLNMISYKVYVDNVLENTFEQKYVGNLLTEEIAKDANGKVTSQYKIEWSDAGRELYTESIYNGDTTTTKKEYNEKGEAISHSISNDIDFTFKYLKHDDQGNWLERVIYSKYKAIVYQVREIEYYEESNEENKVATAEKQSSQTTQR